MNKHLMKGILLIAGTTIGGGMLALPVLTSTSGFFPSLLVYLLCWLFMASTGLLFLEVCLWMKADANIISMAESTLGKTGKYFAWILYLFLFYCLTLAYIVGCGDLISELLGQRIPEWTGSLLFVVLMAPWIFSGAHMASRFNVVLMLGLAVSYCAFVVMGWKHVQPELLLYKNWTHALSDFPIAFAAFAYQGTVPTLVSFMHRNAKQSRIAILVGSFIPFIVYAIWQGLILGIIPPFAPGGLEEALHNGDNAVQPLKNFIDNPSIVIIGQCFAFFALVTSFIGVTLGLFDFLADGLSIKKDNAGKALLSAMIFIPPLIVSFTYPGLFLMALDYAGGFGCSLLLGLLPILMVWSGRYYQGLSSDYALPGGRGLLSVLLFFVLFVLAVQTGLLYT